MKAANIEHLKFSDYANKTLNESSYSAHEFWQAISKILEKDLEGQLSASPAVAVVVDESTDIAVNKRLVLYAQIMVPRA